MVENKTKFGFSLAEAVISLIILATVSLSLLPVLSKQRPGAGIDPTTVRGGFLCYYDEANNQLKQILLHERKQDNTYKPETQGYDCVLQESKRPGRFYYLMVGAGSNDAPGQVVTGFTPFVSGDLGITFGKNDGDTHRDTKIEVMNTKDIDDTGDGSQFTALSASDNVNEDKTIMLNNVKACKIVNGSCPPGVCSEADRTPKACSFIQYETYEDEKDADGFVVKSTPVSIAAIKVDGCECTDEEGNQYTKPVNIPTKPNVSIPLPLNVVPLNEIKRTINLQEQGNNQPNPQGRLDLANVNTSVSYEGGGFTFNIDLVDSSFDKDWNDRAHFSEILNNISHLRQSTFINELVKGKFGAKGKKYGAVVILW